MSKQYRIHIRGKHRERIDADLMARLVVMLGRELAEDARQAAEAAQSKPGGPARRDAQDEDQAS